MNEKTEEEEEEKRRKSEIERHGACNLKRIIRTYKLFKLSKGEREGERRKRCANEEKDKRCELIILCKSSMYRINIDD